ARPRTGRPGAGRDALDAGRERGRALDDRLSPRARRAAHRGRARARGGGCMTATMRRFVRDAYGGPEVLHPEAARVREPRADEVLVRVAASSVNTADVEHLEGRPWVSRVGLGLRVPRNRVPGFDVAGEVLAVGPEVTRLAPGDRVWADVFEHGAGAFAPFVTAPERAFAALPEAVPFEAAA